MTTTPSTPMHTATSTETSSSPAATSSPANATVTGTAQVPVALSPHTATSTHAAPAMPTQAEQATQLKEQLEKELGKDFFENMNLFKKYPNLYKQHIFNYTQLLTKQKKRLEELQAVENVEIRELFKKYLAFLNHEFHFITADTVKVVPYDRNSQDTLKQQILAEIEKVAKGIKEKKSAQQQDTATHESSLREGSSEPIVTLYGETKNEKKHETHEISEDSFRVATLSFNGSSNPQANTDAIYIQKVENEQAITELFVMPAHLDPAKLLRITLADLDNIAPNFGDQEGPPNEEIKEAKKDEINTILSKYLEHQRNFHQPITEKTLKYYIMLTDLKDLDRAQKAKLVETVWQNYHSHIHSADQSYGRFFGYPKQPMPHLDLMELGIKLIEAQRVYTQNSFLRISAKDEELSRFMLCYCQARGYHYEDKTGYNIAKSASFDSQVKQVQKLIGLEQPGIASILYQKLTGSKKQNYIPTLIQAGNRKLEVEQRDREKEVEEQKKARRGPSAAPAA